MRPPAYKLPHLLSLLPKDGQSALVREVKWPATSFWKVQKTKLRILPVEGKDEVKACGHAYGQLFWKGKPITSRKVIPKIKHSLKTLWVTVDASTLSPETLKAIEETDEIITKRQAELKAKAEALKEKRKERTAAAQAGESL